MTQRNDAEAYLQGHELRTDQVQALLHSLWALRGKEIDNKDRIFDIGCGTRQSFVEFWKSALAKRNVVVDSRSHFVGLDIQGATQAGSKDGFLFIGGKDFNSWEPPREHRQQFSLVTAIYSWHWIMGDCDNILAEQRYKRFLQTAGVLLKEDGRLAILHLLTDDPMPEITTIAVEALRTSGIDGYRDISLEEYKNKRKHGWNMPANLEAIQHAVGKANPATSHLYEELLLGSTTWHWLDVDNVWAFWSSVNLPRAFSDLSQAQQMTLEQSFRRILTEEALTRLGLIVSRRTSPNYASRQALGSESGKLFLRVTFHAAQHILCKASLSKQPNTPPTHVAPDLPNRVRSCLADCIPNLEAKYPWFGAKTFIAYNKQTNNEDEDIKHILSPFWRCVPDGVADIYSINLRQLDSRAQAGVGRMLNIGAAEKELFITNDADYLRKLKDDPSKHNLTISELVFASEKNPDDAIIFTGGGWRNYRDWWRNYRDWGQLQPSACTIWVRSKRNQYADQFSPGHVVYAEYLTDIHGWSQNPGIVNFLWFLLIQLRSYGKSTLLVTSNKALGKNDRSLDSASITFLQPRESNSEFPTTSDCFLVIDALQTLAVLRERLRAGQQGQQREFLRWMDVTGHELTKVYSPLAGLLTSHAFKGLGPEAQELVLAFCQHTFVVGDLWTVTGKNDQIINANELTTHKGITSALQRCCDLAWKFQYIKKNATGLLNTLRDNPEAVSKFTQEFSPASPLHSIEVNQHNADVWSAGMLRRWQGDGRFATNWFCLIVFAIVGNAFKHSDSREKITLTVSFDLRNNTPAMLLTVRNIHNNPETLNVFSKKYPSGLHAPSKGTFMVLDQCGRALYEDIGISEAYHLSQFCSVNLTPSTADVTLLFPCGVNAMGGAR